MKLKTNCPEFYNDISETVRAFMEMPIIELAQENADIIVEQQEKRVIMFKIPAAAIAIPTGWKNRYKRWPCSWHYC